MFLRWLPQVMKALIEKPLAVAALLLLLLQSCQAQSASQYLFAPTQPLRVCVLDTPPTVTIASKPIKDATTMSSTVAQTMLVGIGMDMIRWVPVQADKQTRWEPTTFCLNSVLFDQILKWPYNVTYYDNSGVSYSTLGYMIRKNIACDVGVQAFFVDAKRDLCT